MDFRQVSRIVWVSIIFLSSCNGVAGEVAFQPYAIPLRVSANTWGEISFEVTTNVDIPTQLGVASVGVIVDPTRYFGAENTLTVRFDGQEKYYDLHGQDFVIDFEPGYYEKISFRTEGKDIFLELARVVEGAEDIPVIQSTITPTKVAGLTPTFTPTLTPTFTHTPDDSDTWKPCENTYESRLRKGDEAYVGYYPPLRNRVRSRPSTSGSILGYIEPGEELQILDGPECSNHWVWWKIRSKATGLVGWTSEGDNENYWLVPLNWHP